ncbi:hypothetical protein FS837_005681 [Tulasnella sp. UAMH 9824]|nr:hypothetical protein FS837_005681 [Tulasnella sp. UAMH 9824]
MALPNALSIDSLIDPSFILRAQKLLDSLPYSRWQATSITAGALVLYQVSKLLKMWWIDPYFSPLKDLPGPETYESIIWGNFKKILSTQNSVVHEEWFEKYGHVIHYRTFLLSRRLATKDPRALAHILNHAYDYPKPPQIREGLQKLFGHGLLFAEGDDHRRQRKIMNPSFGPAQVRNLLPVFYDKANELKEIWLRQIEDNGSDGIEVDAHVALTQVTLDVVGLAGFGYDFNCLVDGEKNELVRAFLELFTPPKGLPLLDLMANWFPILGRIPTENSKRTAHSRSVMHRVGRKLLDERRAAILAEATGGANAVDKKSVSGKDIFSVMIKANLAHDIKDSERMTDQEVIDQIITIVIAGHETTGTYLDWLLYELSRPENQHIQSKLREELLSVSSDRPTMEELNALPYLDAVIRENLRKNSVVDGTIRCAEKDDIIPLATPFVDRNGVERNEIRIKAGEQVFINIAALNRDKEIWGDDALEFKYVVSAAPDRRQTE